jgi:hypothetical protein
MGARRATRAPAPLPVGETGGSKRQGDPSGGGSPALKGRSESGSAQACASFQKSLDERKRGRPGRPLGSAPALAGALPWRARGAEPHSSSLKKESKRISERACGAIRGSRDRLRGQPQERQRSAAEGGTRDRLPPASDSGATSRLVGINFAFVISSQCCARRCTVCARTLNHRGPHGQESEKGKEDRES